MHAQNPSSAGRFGLAVAAYLVPTFPLGYFWHLTWFQKQYHELDLFREDVIIPLGLASMIIQALLFAWLYPRLFSTSRSEWITSAAKFFAIFTLLAWSFLVLPVAAKYQMTSVPHFMLLETTFTVIQFLVISPLIALAYRQASSPQT